MGLGSFVKKRILRRKGDNEGEPPRPKTRGTTSIPPSVARSAAAAAAAPPARVAKLPVETNNNKNRMKKSTPQKQQQQAPIRQSPPAGDFTPPESPKDRIQRVKSGQMTEDEKEAFLANTLRNASGDSKDGPVVRQKLLDDATIMKRRPKSSATPYPTDSILQDIVMSKNGRNGKDASPEQIAKGDEWFDSQKKKKEYFNMVTDPNRFNRFNTVAGGNPKASQKDLTTPVDMYPNDPVAAEDTPTASKPSNDLARSWLTSGNKKKNDVGPDTMAQRLEQAAMENEQRQKEARLKVEQQRKEEQKRLAEQQRQREKEMAIREREMMAQKKMADEAKAAEAEAQKRREEERQQQLMEAQEAYWKNKLQGEQKRTIQQTTDDPEEALKAGQEAEQAEQAAKIHQEKLTADVLSQVPTREVVKPTEDPTLPSSPTPAPAFRSKIDNKNKSNDNNNPFLNEQKERRAEIDRARDDQIAKLKALNTPIPAPSTPDKPVSNLARAAQSSVDMPRRSAGVAPKSAARSVSQLSDIVNKNDDKKEMSVADALKGDDLGEDEPIPNLPPPPAPKTSGGGGGFGSFFGGNKNNKNTKAKKAPEPPAERKVVRQALPTNDEDEEFEAFARNGPNKNMSLKDAMQGSGKEGNSNQDERSKMWGIDMSRFDD